jgi:aspartyl-tRNA(Asn)/glutamyl-tRNA(Gln) amidotransferase subunit C
MKISKEEVQQVARLARLALEDASLDAMAEQIGTILEYMETLNRIDTSDVEPTAHAVSAATTPVREDTAGGHLDRDKALSNAPHKDGESFLVPRVIG